MSGTRNFLLELHCEEIPARFLSILCDDMKMMLSTDLSGLGVISGTPETIRESVELFFSPRKLAVRIKGLDQNVPDKEIPQNGPPQRMCVDDLGKPTQTGLKFAEKCGVAFEQIKFVMMPGKKEPCAFVNMVEKGRPTIDLLSELSVALIPHLNVPKAMRWGNSDFEFVRPIRNVLCLFGNEVVDFTVDGVRSSNSTWGHRLHHMQNLDPIVVHSPEDYEPALEKAGVVVSFGKRKASMEAQLHILAKEVDGRVVMDDELLNTLAEIVEFPMIVRGEFPKDFLELPKEVLVTSLKEHQKSFCIENEKGQLLPCFLTAANRPIQKGSDAEKLVVAGNEWVLKARLYDARFFFAEDCKAKLEERLDKLKNLTFQRDLGTYFEKTERIMGIAEQVALKIGLNPKDAAEAARLCKADLRTLMVGEFPELQGVMGGEYLKREGAPERVWQAVKEHYRPVGAEDGIPSTPEGCLLSLSDKLDTVVGCFSVGIIPSGSKDPLALRRAGQGVVRILWEQGWSVDVMDLARIALGVAGSKATRPGSDTIQALESFFQDRVAYQSELAGYEGPVRRSALPTGWSGLVDLKARCEALAGFADDPRFESLAQSAKRISNILKDEAPSDAFDGSALQQAEEKDLAARLASLESAVDQTALLTALAELAQPLEAFFTAVMVKCEDPALRAARLSLLHRLRKAFLRVADFSQWQ